MIVNQNYDKNQGGTEGSNKPKKRINSYRGGAAPKAKKMEVDDAISAANGVVNKCTQQVKDIKKVFDEEVADAKYVIDTFNDAANKVPTWIPARIDDKSQASIDKLQKSIDTADFTRPMRQSFDKATMGWIGEHKTAAWTIVICSVLLCVAFACLAVSTAVKQGRAEEQAEQFEQDARNWRQFSAENPRTATKFLKQKEQQF